MKVSSFALGLAFMAASASAQSVTTTITAAPCGTNTGKASDVMVTRSAVSMAECSNGASLMVVSRNATMSTHPASMSGSMTASSRPAMFTGAADRVSAGGLLAGVVGLAALAL